jgi:hypothetical protein
MSVSGFGVRIKIPNSVDHLDPDVVVETLSRHAINVTDAASELGVSSADLRRLLWARPHLTDAAVEIEERRLDLAERNVLEGLKSDDSRTRLAASFFVLRNSHRARRRGWITSSSSVAELSISNANDPRTITYRWRNHDDPPDVRAAKDAETERLRDEGVKVIEVSWGKPDDKLIEHEPGSK